MRIKELLKKAFMEGYATSEIDLWTILLCITAASLLAMYIYTVYKLINKNSFYNKNYNLSLVALAIIVAAIILTIQSNIVVSLGMVGALSIVRFRTAIKEPLDLIFLFWSISTGIICGAGYALIAIVASVAVTLIVIIFNHKHEIKDTVVLVVDANSHKMENEIREIVKNNSVYDRVRARSVTKQSLNIVIETRSNDYMILIDELMKINGISNVSIVDSNGDITV